MDGNDVLVGRDGNDTLNGGAGSDTLIGGAGNDTYLIDKSTDLVFENANGGTDTILSSFNVKALFANVENLTLTSTATIGVGNILNNYLTGNELNNSLSGSSGNDTLDGGLGNDTLVGGVGNDTFYIDSAKDKVVEAANGGTDTIYTKVDLITTAANVENVVLQDGAIAVTGNGSANTITGNEAHNNLNGSGGNDTLIGGGGADALNGGAGNDQLTGGSEADAFIFNTALSASTNVDTITDFETGSDQIFLSHGIFSKFTIGDLPDSYFYTGTTTPVASNTHASILFNQTTGNLYYDNDGTGAAAPVLFAHLLGDASQLSASDFTVV